ncbi:MAG: ParB/RepB/Spo0J family partition protein, partial [Pseudomonadota bacterium]
MAKKPERKKLGRGLSALLGDLPEPEASTETAPAAPGPGLDTLPIDLISPNPEQPRRRFNEAELDELAQSIRARGIIQPVVVRPDPADPARYQIVAGERRWRAAQRAQLHELPAVIRELDDRDVLELAIIENIQRADLNAVEEAEGYTNLIEKFGYTQEELARILGKSRPHVANMMRLLALPTGVLSMLRLGEFTAGHARAMLGAPVPSDLAVEVISKGLSVRQTEERARQLAKGEIPKPVNRPKEKDADTRQLE